MDDKQRNLAGRIIKIIRPVLLLAIIMFYFMGAGVYRYLGGAIDWIKFFSGLVCIILLHNSSMLLNTYFDMQNLEDLHPYNRSKKSENPQIDKKSVLSAGLVTLASGSVLVLDLVIQNTVSPASLLIYFVALLASIAYAVPPIKLSSRGVGEIVLTILISSLYPAFAFLLQNGEMHRLVAMITFPLTPLFLTGWLTSGLSSYKQDILERKMTLLQVVQWNMGMDIHNLLILCSYLIVGMAVLLGLPRSLTWPLLIPIPLSILSIIEVIRIKNGYKPRWSVLLFGSYGAIGCTIYLITFALWTG